MNKDTGEINISNKAIADIVGSTVNSCYGVVSMTSKNIIVDGYNSLLKKDNFSKGVIINKNKETNKVTVDLYVVLSYGVKISEVVIQIQERVKYVLKNELNLEAEAINVNVQGIVNNG